MKIPNGPPSDPERFRRQYADLDKPTVKAEDLSTVADDKAERELQRVCECWLIQREYRRLRAKNAESQAADPQEIRGWFGHLFAAKRNPLMPDLFLFDGKGRYLFMELKVRDKWQPGQREMVNAGMWQCAWSFNDFVWMVQQWEASE